MHWVCWGSPYDELEWIRSDNHQGASLATQHLLDAGCSQIACIASLDSLQRQFKERYDGYAETLAKAGLEPWLVEIEHGLSREEQGRRAVAALLASGRPFDAVFAVCDEIALGALRALSEAGVQIPHQAALIGFDGIRASAHAMPPLSTIEPDFSAAGAMLVDKLLAGIAGESHDTRRVPVRLVARASTAR